LASMNVLAGVEAYLTRHGFDSLGSVIGAALPREGKA